MIFWWAKFACVIQLYDATASAADPEPLTVGSVLDELLLIPMSHPGNHPFPDGYDSPRRISVTNDDPRWGWERRQSFGRDIILLPRVCNAWWREESRIHERLSMDEVASRFLSQLMKDNCTIANPFLVRQPVHHLISHFLVRRGPKNALFESSA